MATSVFEELTIMKLLAEGTSLRRPSPARRPRRPPISVDSERCIPSASIRFLGAKRTIAKEAHRRGDSAQCRSILDYRVFPDRAIVAGA